MDVFFNCEVSPVGDLDEPIQRGHCQERTIVLVMDRNPGIAVGVHVAIGTICDLVIAR